MTATTSDPITNNVERVLVRQTATGFELGIAAGVGFFTAGPLGAAMAFGALKGLQGKWTPWTLLGFIGAPIAIGIQAVTLAVVGVALTPEINTDIDVNPPVVEQMTIGGSTPSAPTY